jgi:hypothetical protein
LWQSNHPTAKASTVTKSFEFAGELQVFKHPTAKMFDGLAKWLHNRGLHLKKYEGSAQMEAM